IVYVLRDAQTGELLKVGKTEIENFISRFRVYEKAAQDTRRHLVGDAWTVAKDAGRTIETVESDIRANLAAQGHSLPWDNTGKRLGRTGPGVPGTRLGSRLSKQGYRWEGENLVKD